MTLFISERERDENGTESKRKLLTEEVLHNVAHAWNPWVDRSDKLMKFKRPKLPWVPCWEYGTHPIPSNMIYIQPMTCREVFASWLPSWLDPWLMAGPTWRNMQSAASHPSASEKSGSEEEAERSCSCTVFLGTCWPFWKGMGCNGKESLVYSEFIIISNTYIHIMYIQYMLYPRHTVKFSADDWDLQSPPQHSI